MSAARIFQPQFQVKLHKLTRREVVSSNIPASTRFQQTGRTIDISSYFSDLGSISTRKSVRGGAGGFTLQFADIPFGALAGNQDAPSAAQRDQNWRALETLYGLIEPNDGIEIRLARNHLTGRRPPIVMRGFVSRPSRGQSVNQNTGAPMRTVSVTGHDYGKIWEMLRVSWHPHNVMGEAFISSFPLFERFGLAIATGKRGDELVREVVEKVINPHLATMLPEDWPMPRSLAVEAVADRGVTSLTGPQNSEGSIYSILAQFLDVTVGFNELFIEDREDQVVVVYRPNPAIDLSGRPIQQPAAVQPEAAPPAATPATPPLTETPGTETIPTPAGAIAIPELSVQDTPLTATEAVATDPETPALPTRLSIPAMDIMSLELSRGDENVANYFWVEGPRFELVSDLPARYMAATGAQQQTVYMTDYPNNSPAIFGMRPMIVSTQMGASEVMTSGQSAAVTSQREMQTMEWLDDRRRILSETNKDNMLLESGECRIAGNENARAGSHVMIGEGALAAPYYVPSVTHEYIPFVGFFTSLPLERGQGFARRIQATGDISPWLIEMGAGAAASQDPARSGTGNAGDGERSMGQTGEPGTAAGGASPLTEGGALPSTSAQPSASID
ncbi:hypothetical protein EOD42_22415 [Rhodovarius crocodyli]|uniref:Uncharacterized protein n=1 Tax=Rhodovarius crocodyli TaxID=1979269 RepID=A0A437M1C7_9PROT|nr:hypothetical protein [Rhodovarius crocodyli]RVT91412.1 hypothetical protein EOD42_22415 [Rhodovarius crocodyli]